MITVSRALRAGRTKGGLALQRESQRLRPGRTYVKSTGDAVLHGREATSDSGELAGSCWEDEDVGRSSGRSRMKMCHTGLEGGPFVTS